MNSSSLLVLFLVAVTSSAVLGANCPLSCRLPTCRCWDNPIRPGNFSNAGTPQIVTLTFSYAMNNHTLADYLPLFKGLVNPNLCPPKGTFFAQDLNTNVSSLRRLYQDRHEVALTAADGRIPTSRKEWVESLFRSSEKLYDAGLPRNEVRGVRSPNLFMGGNDELQAEVQFGMMYEASCVTKATAKNGQMLWPFTYDSVGDNPRCSIGKTPTKAFPGMWQFLMPSLTFDGHECATLSSCSPYIKTQADAFSLLYNSFDKYYQNGRAPMVLSVDPEWLTKKVQVDGLRQFLEVIGRFEDTWIVTLDQALQWIRFPVPLYKTVRYLPWDCSKAEKTNNKKYNRR